MPTERREPPRAGWWQRQRQARAARALDLQLEYQRNKSRSLQAGGADITPHMKRHAEAVRALVAAVRPHAPSDRVLEVGSGAHGLIFFFGGAASVGIDPLAHHYVSLFPAWQRRAATASAIGEALPFAAAAFDVVLSDNVVDHAERPEAILDEIVRVLAPSGALFFAVNVSHPVYGWLSRLQGAWRAIGVPFEITDFAEHTVHLSLEGARALLGHQPLRVMWERDAIAEARAARPGRQGRRLRAWIKGLFYFNARYEAVAIREPH